MKRKLLSKHKYYLYVIKVDELPSTKMSTNGYIHVFNSCSLQPTTTILKGFDSPDTSGSIKAKEVDKDTINLLFDFKVERQVYVL